MYNFASASDQESIVFGAARPGYRDEQVTEWIAFMQRQGIQRVCCLLTDAQLKPYANLLARYQQTFGVHQVCWSPIEDFHLVTPDQFTHQILPFFMAADQRHEKVVVHCAAGIGRTGQVLAAWLIAGRGFSKPDAIAAVKQAGRNPHEAILAAPFKGRNPWKLAAELDRLWDECDRSRN
jgi:protein-tyrosine phosphatase